MRIVLFASAVATVWCVWLFPNHHVLMRHCCVAALGNAAAAVPEEVMLDRELTRTGSTLSSKLSSRSSALSSKLSTRSSAPRYAASTPD